MDEVLSGVPASHLDVTWTKSSYSAAQGNCVEVAGLSDGSVAVRNSRYPHGPALVYRAAEWQALVQGIKDGEFDHPGV